MKTSSLPSQSKEFISLSGLNLPEIENLFKNSGLPAFRSRQIHTWIYDKYANSFDEMTDLPAAVRESLNNQAKVAFA